MNDEIHNSNYCDANLDYRNNQALQDKQSLIPFPCKAQTTIKL